jgi:amino acid transporter
MALAAGKSTPFVFLLALLVTLPTAICYGMISKEIPSSGSAYTWLWEAMNPVIGIWIGWILTAYFIIVVFLQPLLFGLFFNDLLRSLGITAGYCSFLVSVIMSSVIVAATTYRGIEISEKGSFIGLILQMVIVAALAATIIFVLGMRGKLDFTPFLPSSSSQGLSGISEALIFGILSFCGFGVISNVAEETKNPRKAIPIAIVLSCIVIGLYWVVISWAYVISGPIERVIDCVKADIIPVVPIAKQYWGVGDILIIFTGMIAALGVYIATVIGSSRVLYAMGRDGSISSVFCMLNKKYRVPWNALHFIFVLTFIFVLIPASILGIYNTFIWWAKAVVFFALTTYLFVCIANPVLYFRYQRKKFNFFWNGIVAVTAFGINLYLLYKAFFVECWKGGWVMGKSVIVFVIVWLFLGILYIFWLKRYSPDLFTKKAQFLREE